MGYLFIPRCIADLAEAATMSCALFTGMGTGVESLPLNLIMPELGSMGMNTPLNGAWLAMF